MNSLIIFDIDSTLIEYINCEDQAYLTAISSITGIKSINTDWESYRYSTDSGVLSEIIWHVFKRVPTDNEVLSIKNKFTSLLSDSFKQEPCQAITGAKAILVSSKHWAGMLL